MGKRRKGGVDRRKTGQERKEEMEANTENEYSRIKENRKRQ